MARREAAAALVRLLADPALPYRERWARPGVAVRRGQPVNRTAVGRVVAAHLVETGAVDELDERAWPRRHKDWLARRLDPDVAESEHHLDRDSLELLLAAFDVHPRHRAQVRAAGDSAAGVHPLVPTASGDRPTPSPGSRRYHSLHVVEEHEIGEDGRPRRHRTTQTLVSEVDGLTDYTYAFDSARVAVEVLGGGQIVRSPDRVGEDLWGQEIRLDRVVARGERFDLAYVTYFHYETDPEPEFRRMGSADEDATVEVAVRFDPRRRPVQVRLCVWPAVEDDPLAEAVVALDHHGGVRAVFPRVRARSLVGFRWVWPG